MSILDEVVSKTPSVPVYHYTTQMGFMGILNNREIWATHTQYLNDSREFLHAIDLVREQLRPGLTFGNPDIKPVYQALTNSLDGMESINLCVCSFSEEPDSLLQWRAYGGASGFAIGFTGAFIEEVAKKNDWAFVPCIYDRERQEHVARALIQEIIEFYVVRAAAGSPEALKETTTMFAGYLQQFAPLLKDPAFKDEKEWRLISNALSCRDPAYAFCTGPSMLIPYYKLPLIDIGGRTRVHEVVIGPTPHPKQAERAVRSFLLKEFMANVPVTLSKVPYRSW